MTKLKDAIVTRSNYTIKSKKKETENSILYERDYMTTTNNGGWDSGIIPYGESNFKMITSTNYSLYKKKNNDVNNNEEQTFSLDLLSVRGDNITENKNETLSLNVNGKSLRDFCYYNSASDLVKVTINEIISKFPGELYVTNDSFQYGNVILGEDEIKKETGYTPKEHAVVIYNPFLIDIVSNYVPKNSLNPLRYFCENRKHYVIYDSQLNMKNCDALKWEVIYNEEKGYNENTKIECLSDGDLYASVKIYQKLSNDIDIRTEEEPGREFIIYVYYINGIYMYITSSIWSGYHIRPDKISINDFFSNIGLFANFLLNEKTRPIYTIYLNTERENNGKVSLVTERLTWPTFGGWNIMTSGEAYENYLKSLIRIASEYDEKYTNNLWRMLTHDSIKNMDKTFENTSKNEDITDYDIGISSLNKALLSIAEMYDLLKLYIDGVKNSNSISYNTTNINKINQLIDKLEISGWDCINPSTHLNNEDIAIQDIGKVNLDDINLTFYKNLLLNSRSILLKKGTRESIEMVLGLFGFISYDFARKRYQQLPYNQWYTDEEGKKYSWDEIPYEIQSEFYDYKIDEYVSVCENTEEDIVDGNELLPFEKYSELVNFPNNKTLERLGLPIKIVTLMGEINGEIVTKKYMIPWFEKDNNRDIYFQMYGGWDKQDCKIISDNLIINSDNKISIYDETISYTKIVPNIYSLTRISQTVLSDGVIYYVNDITDINLYINGVDSKNISNYFILNNKNNSNKIGTGGWEYVTKEELKTGYKKDTRTNEVTKSDNAIKVIYISSLLEDFKGNNPHKGNGKYDEGNEFLKYFKQIFKYYIDRNLFLDEAYDCQTGDLLNEIKTLGFKIDGLTNDNMKIWYFSDNSKENIHILNKNVITGEYEDGGAPLSPYVGEQAYKNNDTTFDSKLNAFNMETQETNNNDEASANSIINLKNIQINFSNNVDDINSFRKYLVNVVLPYVKQVIPSTAILKTTIGEFTDYSYDSVCFEYPELTGTFKRESNN